MVGLHLVRSSMPYTEMPTIVIQANLEAQIREQVGQDKVVKKKAIRPNVQEIQLVNTLKS